MAFTLDTIHHTGLIVRDMEPMLAFYRDLFGTEPKSDTVIEGAELEKQLVGSPKMRVVFFELDNAAVELIEYLKPRGDAVEQETNTMGTMHLCFKVSDANEAFAKLKAHGIEFHGRPAHLDASYGPMAGYSWAYFRDPEGNILEIMEDPSLAQQAKAKLKQAL